MGFATQASIDPPRFVVFISKRNRTHEAAGAAGVLAVHLVPDDSPALAERFGGETADEVDKFAGVEWAPGPGGVPLLAACPDWFAGRVVGRLDGGDHTGLLLEPVAAEASGEGAGLGLQDALHIEPGHEA